ncbi:hypothetical protein C8E03_105188 [Lachnotalea glycerini]|uniref:Uncharacterized protein n=1 Tax=Lachnotalea glycerini TaxID=1763509 RepID=A0A255P6H5_9FIRM|nr:hypothetical protein [Lachnotalea glycerini]OYP11446.1 hypothetical protein CG709_08715 [Lachnotalea glycerini]PXV90279.1 hypothetical protein C8E03_105188 [Lachnotalea glycerini]RDY31033.1 hypothetical protein CG710_011675 [Lachnotalea glycerini]
MKVTAIRTSYNRYYYQKNEASIITRANQTVSKDIKLIETTQTNTYQTPVINNSAEYVKNAYQVSFKPFDLIQNLQEA